MSLIHLSESYLASLKNYLSTISSKTREILFFKKDGAMYLSKMEINSSVWVNIKTGLDNADFDGDEVGVENLEEFLNYLKNVNYPKDGSTLTYAVARNASGTVQIPSFFIEGKGCKYVLPVANTGACFVDSYDRKIATLRSSDPLTFVGKFLLKAKEVEFITHNIKLMGSPPVFGLSIINGAITIYVKGTSNQQFQKTIDPLCAQVLGSYTTLDATSTDGIGCKLFPKEFFMKADEFGCDYEFEIRMHEAANKKLWVIKAYGKHEPKDKSPIEILLATHESDSQAVVGNYEVLG